MFLRCGRPLEQRNSSGAERRPGSTGGLRAEETRRKERAEAKKEQRNLRGASLCRLCSRSSIATCDTRNQNIGGSCIATKLELHKESLQVVYRYICALNRARSDATARGETLNHRDNTVHSPDQAMGDRAKQFMIEYSLTDSFNLVEGDITLEQVNANIQGARLAHCVWEWAKTHLWRQISFIRR